MEENKTDKLNYYEFPLKKRIKVTYLEDVIVNLKNNIDVNGVLLLLENGEKVENASAVIVSVVKENIKGSSFIIELRGKRDLENGRYYNDYNIEKI